MKSVALFLIVLMVWTVGLLAFAARVDKSTPADEPDPAQAIVALTGNATMRITTGVKLLELNKGKRLLVSGVNKDVRPAELQSVSKATRGVYDCCIDLGYEPNPWCGYNRSFFVNSVTGWRVFVQTGWCE